MGMQALTTGHFFVMKLSPARGRSFPVGEGIQDYREPVHNAVTG